MKRTSRKLWSPDQSNFLYDSGLEENKISGEVDKARLAAKNNIREELALDTSQVTKQKNHLEQVLERVSLINAEVNGMINDSKQPTNVIQSPNLSTHAKVIAFL